MGKPISKGICGVIAKRYCHEKGVRFDNQDPYCTSKPNAINSSLFNVEFE